MIKLINVQIKTRCGKAVVLVIDVSIRGIVGEELLSRIPEITASTGSACHAESTDPSGVLLEMGLDRELALGALRLTLGRWSTQEEIDVAGELVVERVMPPGSK